RLIANALPGHMFLIIDEVEKPDKAKPIQYEIIDILSHYANTNA
ncbi:14382_t:CDS:1, partial [Entrophospora sp. SA101]